MSESTEIGSQAQKRDLLGQVCFYLHFAVMIFIVAGWVLPWRGALWFYAAFLPAVVLQWRLNKDSCVLNNTENWLRTGKWHNKAFNPEEGAWVLTLARNVTGLAFTAAQMDALTYGVLLLVWLLGFAHLFWR